MDGHVIARRHGSADCVAIESAVNGSIAPSSNDPRSSAPWQNRRDRKSLDDALFTPDAARSVLPAHVGSLHPPQERSLWLPLPLLPLRQRAGVDAKTLVGLFAKTLLLVRCRTKCSASVFAWGSRIVSTVQDYNRGVIPEYR
jgi:hypothetical protein